MEFSVDVWRERAARKLGEASKWLEQRRRDEAPFVVYGTVAGKSNGGRAASRRCVCPRSSGRS